MFKALLVSLTLFASSVYSEVIQEHGLRFDTETQVLRIYGDTTEPQANLAKEILESGDVSLVIMSGPGGHFASGLVIGNAIAEAGVTALVEPQTMCMSACAFAAMASRNLVVGGELFFHSPFMNQVPSAASLIDIQTASGIVYFELVNYIVNHGYSIYVAGHILNKTTPCSFLVVDSTSNFGRAKGSILSYEDFEGEFVNNCQ